MHISVIKNADICFHFLKLFTINDNMKYVLHLVHDKKIN